MQAVKHMFQTLDKRIEKLYSDVTEDVSEVVNSTWEIVDVIQKYID